MWKVKAARVDPIVMVVNRLLGQDIHLKLTHVDRALPARRAKIVKDATSICIDSH
jgi:hypothetical protein